MKKLQAQGKKVKIIDGEEEYESGGGGGSSEHQGTFIHKITEIEKIQKEKEKMNKELSQKD